MMGLYRAARTCVFGRRSGFNFSTQADPYYILGIEKTASFQEIRLAFYKLANEFHPDKNDSNVPSPHTSSKPRASSWSSSRPSKASRWRKVS